ncbi:MAG: BatD family protein [Victivallales bacterium]|nr:BatD family protein [Victivallales bacterium]
MRRVFFILAACCLACFGEPKIREEIETRDVAVGEAFIYQVVVSDAKHIEDIVFPPGNDFQVRAFPPSQNNSSQISIVNGQVKKLETHETIFRFSLVPKRKGTLIIPQLKVVADGKTLHTRPVRINAGDGEQITDIILELSFDVPECHVGQTIMAKWTLFFARQLTIEEFNLPLFSDKTFAFPSYEDKIDQSQIRSYKRLPVAGVDGVIGKLSAARHNGTPMNSLSFSRPVTALKAGDFSFDAGTVICQIPDRRAQTRRSSDPFQDSFFNGFFDRTPMKSILVKGNTVTLNVKELPKDGCPADFTGILGQCSLTVTANPVDVNVGDPIVMTLAVNGLSYPDAVRIPQITKMQELSGKFRVSDEDSGIVRDGAKVFQCTLRAVNGEVTEIPALKVPYFNSATGKYEHAESKPIPITVHEVATVTAADIQGTSVAQDAPAGTEVESLDAGIAHNYAPDRLLGTETPGFSRWTITSWKPIACAGSLLCYIMVAIIVSLVRHAKANPQKAAAQQALANATKGIAMATDGDSREMLNALQTIIAAKLRLNSTTISFNDVAKPLEAAGMDVEHLHRLSGIFSDLEAANYAGGAARKGLAEDVREIVREIHRL